jgi:hypothetical protein
MNFEKLKFLNLLSKKIIELWYNQFEDSNDKYGLSLTYNSI